MKLLQPFELLMQKLFHFGCNISASVLGRGKETFYEAWKLTKEISELFLRLSTIKNLREVSEKFFKVLEKFFLFLYCVTMNSEDVNADWSILFTQRGSSPESIARIVAAWKEHILSASIKSYMWPECIQKNQTCPNLILPAKNKNTFVPVFEFSVFLK